jgi:hypothetical protein
MAAILALRSGIIAFWVAAFRSLKKTCRSSKRRREQSLPYHNAAGFFSIRAQAVFAGQGLILPGNDFVLRSLRVRSVWGQFPIVVHPVRGVAIIPAFCVEQLFGLTAVSSMKPSETLSAIPPVSSPVMWTDDLLELQSLRRHRADSNEVEMPFQGKFSRR